MKARAQARKFDASYRERVRLDDGTEVILRTIRPTDRELLRRGFEGLSPESRFLRFLSARPNLSEGDLRRLTELDGTAEFALGAVVEDPDCRERGLGVARFARDRRDPSVAEAAVAVIDAYQGRGLGRRLLRRLVAAAVERDVRRFRCELLARNDRVLRMVRAHAPGARFEVDDDRIRAEIELTAVSDLGTDLPDGSNGALGLLLRQSARGAIEVRLRQLLLKGSVRETRHEPGESPGGRS